MAQDISIGDYRKHVKGEVGVNLASEHNKVDIVLVDTPDNRETILELRSLRNTLSGLQAISLLPDQDGSVVLEQSRQDLATGYEQTVSIREVGFVTRQ